MDTQTEKTFVVADIMKRRKQDISKSAMKVQQRVTKIKQKKQGKQRSIVPIDELIQDYRKQQSAYSNYKKRSIKILRSNLEGNDSKLLIVMRIRGVKDISEQQNKILKSLNLYGPMCAVFLKQTTQNLNKLKRVENYITYGIPTRKLVSELIFKRCFGRVNGKRVAINTNKIVEEQLGEKYGLICLEDLVNEIIDQGEHFLTVLKFLYPFKLNQPQTGFDINNITKPFNNGGEWGDRENKINDLLFNMI